MAERNCKFFSPNYFNPTKCQNCFKPKEHHPDQSQSTGNQTAFKRSSLSRNTPPSKTVLKESVLYKACLEKENTKPEKWEKLFFRLYSNGELQEFEIVNSQVNKENIKNTLMLQDFIRMLDGKQEIQEDLCFGIKTLRNIYYFKTISKVDYENWWKEVSSFVAAPIIKRTTSGFSRANHYSKPNLSKQLSLPLSSMRPRSPTTRSSRSSSTSSTIPEIDSTEMESLRGQVSRLEEENSKLAKSEEQRRKLELEVNYWKEYVTNAQQLKRSGGTIDTANELAETRKKLIQTQDEVNETQKRLKMNSGKLIMQNRELSDTKLKLQEANSLVAVYKAKIEQMAKELLEKSEASKETTNLREQKALTASTDEIFYSPKPVRSKTMTSMTASPSPDMSGAQELEDKFLVLKDKMKRIEKELFLKSKELEKANESRFKVAKYTRSLLQELESRLSDTQQKLTESEDKLKHSNTELKMERERRLQLEEGPRRRMSSVASPPKPIASEGIKDTVFPVEENSTVESAKSSEFTEHDADTKYADYYRSRFKEAEDALLEKDKKLHQAEEKIKQIQTSMKSNSDSYKVINELQSKLSDATHKLSDRQLKIHELTREIDRLKGYEKTYEKKTQQCHTLEEIVKDLENTNAEQGKNLHQSKQDLEILKIREVVLKEQLQTLLEDSDDENEDEEEQDKARLNKSIELKNQINCMVELEAQVKKLSLDNEKLTSKNTELEHRLRNANIQHFKTIESGQKVGSCDGEDTDVHEFKNKIKELESKLASSEDRHCDEMSNMKEKHYKELAAAEKQFKDETSEMKDQLTVLQAEKESSAVGNEDEINELRGRITMLNLKVSDMEEKLRDEIKAHKSTETTLADRSNLVKEMEAQCQRLTAERDALKGENTSNRRDSYGVYDDDSVEGDERVTQLSTENHELKVKVRQLERKLRVSLERYEDIVASMREKGLYGEGKEKDRDSGIVITQEIKNLMDSFKKDDELINEENYNYTSLIENLSSGVTLEEDPLKKYKQLSANLAYQLKELGKKFILSEEKSLELTIELEQRQTQEDEYMTGYNFLLTRIEDLNQQIIDSQEVLQSEADELDLERKNVLNLVEVTSAYIKELEGSLGESKIKIQDLQEAVEKTKATSLRPAPEGEAEGEEKEEDEEKDGVDGLMASKPRTQSEEQVEDMKVLQGILTAKVIALETEITEIKEQHTEEVERLKGQSGSTDENREKEDEDQEEIEELLMKIDSLHDELEEQKESYENDITNLTERFQEELKSAFGSDQGSMDMLTRLQELECEMMKTKRESDQIVKDMKDQCEKEKQQMKDDMATVLQATLSSMGGDFSQPEETKNNDGEDSSTVEQLQDRIIELEQELIDIQERCDEELEMEKEAHQAEMEDTIRDMMMVRAMSGQRTESSSSDAPGEEDSEDPNGLNSSRGSVDLNTKKKIYTSEEVESIKGAYEKKISVKEDEHQDALDQVRSDMAIVISSLKQGSSSDTIMELQSRIKELEQEHEDARAEYEENLQKVEMTLKKSESKNFFAFRRNEEMGAKIYQMQTEIEELDRKHCLEVQIYQERLSALGGGTDIDSKAADVLKANAELEEKVDNLQLMLNTLRNERENEMETLSMQLREEKRAGVEEMTDKVLKLEAIIDDMKESHAKEIESYEKIQRDTKLEASSKDNKRIEELEILIGSIEKNHEKEIEELAEEHKKVVEELRHFYEKEIGEMKKRSSSDVDGGSQTSSRKPSVDQMANVKQVTKELTEKHEKEMEALRTKHEKDKKLMEEQQEREISDIRTQYDEKLKIGYKEGLRRQSVSERRSDGQRMRELIGQKEAAESKAVELEIKYENLESRNSKLQKLVSELKSKIGGDSVDSAGKQSLIESAVEDSSSNYEDEEAVKKLKEIQEQIERYQRRIEYYREKSQREKTEESHRVSELQSEIVELHKEMNNIKEKRRKQIYEKEKRTKAPADRTTVRRNTDGSTATRRHTDSDTTLSKMTRPRDPRKRWSNLEERSEVIARNIATLDGKRNPKLAVTVKKEEGKSGTVSARKTLWESIQDEPTTPTSKAKSLPRALGNVR